MLQMPRKEENSIPAEEYTVPAGCVAILLGTYNGEKYLEEQLRSLEQQTFRNFRCFIHDDGSGDRTPAIAESFAERHPDRFVYLGSSRTGGAKYNFMFLLRHVRAEYIMFCDQDDVWLPEKVEKTLRAMRKAEKETARGQARLPICVYSDLMVVDSSLNVLNRSFYAYRSSDPEKTGLLDLLYQNVAPGCAMMINGSLRRLALAGGEVEDRIRMHDWLLILLARCCGEVVFIAEPLILYRQHEDNAIGVQKEKSLGRKLSGVLHIGAWVNGKRTFLNQRRDNARAVLTCVEKFESGGCGESLVCLREDVAAGVEEIRKFIRKQSRPLAFRILGYYRWKWS